ncbi:MAG: hypothetical protein C0425_09555 [Chlorobiaceae bacterium]|nr:hypothetical protein [Chlorobiaceae bacterium]
MVAIFVLITFLLIIGINLLVSRLIDKKITIFQDDKPQLVPEESYQNSLTNVLVPEGLFFSKGHTWLQIDLNGQTRIGVDDFINKLTSSFVLEMSKKVGDKIKRGEKFLKVKFNGKLFNIASPIDGEIREINHKVLQDPSALKSIPYEGGWLLMVEPTNLKDDLSLMIIGKDVIDWMRNELHRFKEFLGSIAQQQQPSLVGQTMYDGGAVKIGAISTLDENCINELEQKFFTL